MSHLKNSVVFCDTQFTFASWITKPTQWNEAGVLSSIRIETGNASTSCFLDEFNARALIVALEEHISNIAQVRNELMAIQQLQKKDAAA